MTVHSLHIFDRRGKTLFTKRYSSAATQSQSQQQQNPAVNNEEVEEQLSEQRKLVFGMLFSLRELMGSLSPASAEEGAVCPLHSVRTGATTLHNYETVSGLRFAMYTNNDPAITRQSSDSLDRSRSGAGGSGGGGDHHHGGSGATSVREALKYIYSEIWVECVVRSPLYRSGLEGSGTRKFDIHSTNFEKRLDAYLSAMPWFR